MSRWIRASLLALLCCAAPARADVPPVHGVIFTHIEDNTPGGTLGSVQSRNSYLTTRSNMIAMAAMAESVGMAWTLQPDWKILEAALLYEDAALRATTNGKNLFVYLKEDRAVTIDPHSHENGGYNYTDIAHLLDSLGVGATTVIGGHIWDPSLPQFAEWDRFRVPVQGEHYPNAWWRGDILIGSGSPNHINDPIVSGVWHPRDRDHYFEDDPAGNIVAIGQWKRSVATVSELIDLYRSGEVPPTAMLTFSFNINPMSINSAAARQAVLDTMLVPLKAWVDSGLVVMTNFTDLIATWNSSYGGAAYLYNGAATASVLPVASAMSIRLAPPAPNPVRAATTLRYSLAREGHVRMTIYDVSGRRVAELVDGVQSAGEHSVRWEAGRVANGIYLCRIEDGAGEPALARIVVAR